MKTLQELTRPNIWKLKPYSSARDEYKGYTASVFLDANEKLLPISFWEMAVMRLLIWYFVHSASRVKIMWSLSTLLTECIRCVPM